MMKAALRVSRNCRAHLSDFYVAPWSACLHAFRVTPGTRKAVLRPLPRFNCSNGIIGRMAEVGLFKLKAKERSDMDEMPLGTSRLTDNTRVARTEPELASIVKPLMTFHIEPSTPPTHNANNANHLIIPYQKEHSVLCILKGFLTNTRQRTSN